jgi:hypothetical protein
MKYKTPELTALTSAINAIQSSEHGKPAGPYTDLNPVIREETFAYQDWE